MKLPYRRPRFIEIHDQPFCPEFIRQHIQTVLTFLWIHRMPVFQAQAPYVAASEVLEEVIKQVEDDLGSLTPTQGHQGVRVVDCCSGAGGPMPAMERRINESRRAAGKKVIPILLSDLHPHLPAWTKHAKNSSSGALSFLPYSVDATHAPSEVRRGRHIRTFCLSFHHFGEEGARRVLEDTMRTAQAVVVFELQESNIASAITIIALWPLLYLITPFTRPSLSILLLTYVIPLIPFILVFDGLISAWRTRTIQHVRQLADLASLTLALEGTGKEGMGWKWTTKRCVHTRPFGRMFAIVGRKVSGDTEGEGDEEGESEVWYDLPDDRDRESVVSEDDFKK